jgi:hypothetical protein
MKAADVTVTPHSRFGHASTFFCSPDSSCHITCIRLHPISICLLVPPHSRLLKAGCFRPGHAMHHQPNRIISKLSRSSLRTRNFTFKGSSQHSIQSNIYIAAEGIQLNAQQLFTAIFWVRKERGNFKGGEGDDAPVIGYTML